MTRAHSFSFRQQVTSRKPRRLCVEGLESRTMMSAMPFDFLAGKSSAAAMIGPRWQGAVIRSPSPIVGPAPIITRVPIIAPSPTPVAPQSGFAHFTSLDDYRQYVINQLTSRYQDLFGKPCQYYIQPLGGIYFNGMAGAVASGTVVLSAAQPASTVNTNDQVAGVSEADLMQTDGNYLYMLSQGELVIVDLRTPDTPAIAGRLKLSQSPSAMYLDGDRVTLISSAYDCDGSNSFGGHTTATVVDISDRTAPTIVTRTVFDGNLLSSRAIGDHVYLVFQPTDFASTIGGPQIVHNDGTPLAPGESPYYSYCLPCVAIAGMYLPGPTILPRAGNYRYETQQEYLTRIGSALSSSLLPHYTTYDAGGNQLATGYVCNPTSVYKPPASNLCQLDQNFTTVATIDVKSTTSGPSDSLTIPTGGNVKVYSSTTSMYLLDSSGTTSTTIDKIDISAADGKLHFAAQGSVKGYVLDQFSADESGQYLRIATTEGSASWGSDVMQEFRLASDINIMGTDHSQTHLFVLQQSGNSLNVVGAIDNLAPSEKIYSVRFQGPAAYVVTYRQMDPLFAIDLSDPTAPKLAGHLDLPGVSNYLQSVGDGFLVGVGRTGDGPDGGFFSDPQVSLFNVKDLSNPALVNRVTIPAGRSGGIGVFDDHHVVEYYADQGILTVSMPAASSGSSWNYSTTNDLYVFRVDTSTATPGLTLTGTIAHDDSVLRSVEVGGRLISISDATIEVHDFNQPNTVVASLTINPPDSGLQVFPTLIQATPPQQHASELLGLEIPL